MQSAGPTDTHEIHFLLIGPFNVNETRTIAQFCFLGAFRPLIAKIIAEGRSLILAQAQVIRHLDADSVDIIQKIKIIEFKKVTALLPGMKSPSILPLAEKGWFSLHSVIEENDFWNIIENLRDAGAEGILVLPIEKMIL